jgi:tetratricopeptide (TPR) repeat protein/predicted Ser/Thr protein kinase
MSESESSVSDSDTLGPADDDTLGGSEGSTSTRRRGVALASGDRVGRYVVLAKLGAGGMGVVYAAYDPELDRKIALKLLRSDPWGGSPRADSRARLLREAQALAKFSHSGIVTVHDVGEHEGAVWLAMEFVDGRTLGAWAEAAKPGWKEVLAAMLAAGRGVAAAHAAGMIHRDLKPDNIMVANDGHVRVMDFGLTRPVSETSVESGAETPIRHESLANSFTTVTVHGSLLGTPAYMAPELFEGKEASTATDQFAYCVTMWELLYGERPFDGRTILAIVDAVLKGKLPSPPKGPRVPSWLRRVCERGLARAPAERWPSMEVLLAQLERGQSRVHRQRIAIGLGLVAALAGAVEGARRYDRAQRIAECEAAGDSIEQSWNDEARARVREGLLATGVAHAQTSADKVMPYLDERATQWRALRTSACLHTEIEATWTPATFERAVWCLDERRLEFESLIGEFANADVDVVGKAVSAAAGLTTAEPCVDEFVLRNLPEPPSPESRAAIGELRGELARVGALLAAGKIPEGLEAVRPVRIEAESLGWPPLVAAARQREGQLLELSGEFAAAEAMSLSAYVEAAKASVWEVAADAAIDLTLTVGDRQVRHAEGRVWAEHAAVAIAHAGDPLGLRTARRAANLGHVELVAGDYDRAQALYQRSLDIGTEALGPDHPMLATSMNNLGNLHRARLDFDQAKFHFERSLALRENAVGPNHPDTATSLHNLGLVLDEFGEHERAQQFYERALTTWETTLGPEHPNTAVTLSALATSWGRQGDLERATHFQARALAILEQTLGPDHPDVAALVNNLALVTFDRGEFEQAKALHRRALTIHEKTVGVNHPDVAISLFNLAMVHSVLGEYEESKQLLERSLPIAETTYGMDHPEVAWILSSIGDADVALDRPEQGLIAVERALVIFDAHEGEQGGESVARFALAKGLIATGGDRDRAIREGEKALAGFRAIEDAGALAKVEQWLAASRG